MGNKNNKQSANQVQRELYMGKVSQTIRATEDVLAKQPWIREFQASLPVFLGNIQDKKMCLETCDAFLCQPLSKNAQTLNTLHPCLSIAVINGSAPYHLSNTSWPWEIALYFLMSKDFVQCVYKLCEERIKKN